MPNQVPAPVRFRTGLQEDLVTLLCWSDSHGQLVARLADPHLFEGDLRDIAVAAVDYWQRYGSAPKLHTSNLLEAQMQGRRGNNLRRLIFGMQQLHERINTDYVLHTLQHFVRKQRLKGAILQAAQLLTDDNADNEEVERLLNEVLRAKDAQYDAGTRLDDELEPFLEYLERQHSEFVTGIAPLDDNGIVPARGTVFLFIAGKGRGKTWFLISVGAHALTLRKRVLHVSLEIDQQEMRARYFQNLWAVPRYRRRELSQTSFELDTDDKITALQRDRVEPDFSFSSRAVRSELESRILAMGERASDLIIKRFPNRSLSVDGLAGYLDALEHNHKFTPDIVLLDYAKLMKIDARTSADYRLKLGQNLELLRALAIERNFALVTADQLNRTGYERRTAHSTHIGEDWSQTHTSDIVVTHSATDAERRLGLCRLYVDHARTEADKFGVLLAQNFETGQFAIDARLLPKDYFETLAPAEEREEVEERADMADRVAVEADELHDEAREG